MPVVIEGGFQIKDKKIGLVAGRFNTFITEKLVDGAVDTLRRHGIRDEDITLAWTPGAFEIPVIAKKMAKSGKFDAIITLGCVIRGGTPHFDYVAGEAAKGIGMVALEQFHIPILFGVLTTDNIEQAIERAGTKAGNKGADAALAAIEMINLMEQF